MKRVLKWAGILFALVITGTLACVLCVWGYYRHVVGAKPGSLSLPVPAGELGAQVNLFSGTGGFSWMCGHNTPAATTPFGMVRLAPDTAGILTNSTGSNRSGYFYGDNKIIGFSHTRLVGADALDGGVFRIFPSTEVSAARDLEPGRSIPFSHRDETAAPGYYAVRLPKRNVLVELTATPRVGVHRYTFETSSNDFPHLLLDCTSVLGDKRIEGASAKILPNTNEVVGHAKTFGSFSGRYDGLDVYFVARFSEPFKTHGTWQGSLFESGATEVSGEDFGVDVAFPSSATGPTVVEVRVALSCVSIPNARLNLDAEAGPERTFEDIAAAARDAWESRLSRIKVEGESGTQRRIFYTALYRAFQMPTVFTDVNGEYTGFDRATHRAEGFQYYTDFSLWDTCRTVQPLYYLIAREDARDMMVSLVEMAKAGGCLPRWPSGCGYTNCMLGTPADIAVSEAYLKGIRDFDIETAYQAMRQTGLTGKPEGTRFAGREGLDSYLKYGYCTSDSMDESVASTLEFACEDNAIALLAEALGHPEDAAIFAQHAKNYRNVWNAERQFFDSRDSSGNFQQEFNPLKLTYLDSGKRYTRGYVEGSAWQWRWFVPHDPKGLVSLFKSREYFVDELSTFFENSNEDVGEWNPGPYYWHGNEPDIHAVYLFNAAGRPDLTQRWVRHLLNTKYSDDYVGLDGNDDGGTLSAWYVFSALGFYPVAGTTKYEIGSPLFTRATVDMGDATLTVLAPNNSPENVYVQQAFLNGQPLQRTWFTHDEIQNGGELRFEMGATPPPTANP
ncbi:MAG: GH92 family glycosyl hydrolase [Candidatus Hydrogenedentes bacterium]|nr:GH92 family glycosyl hydrolase [Candidatus Hydrogenedentota bacterium]